MKITPSPLQMAGYVLWIQQGLREAVQKIHDNPPRGIGLIEWQFGHAQQITVEALTLFFKKNGMTLPISIRQPRTRAELRAQIRATERTLKKLKAQLVTFKSA